MTRLLLVIRLVLLPLCRGFANAYLGDKISINSDKQQGYWIASGRVSYLTSIVGPLLRAIDGDSNFQLPQYYDYQLKGKLFLDEKEKHSLKVLFFGLANEK